MGRNCFGSPGPARTPAPAATTTTPTSGCETAGELTDSLQPDHLEVANPGGSTRASRQKHAPEPLPRGFGQAPLHAGDRTDFAAEAYLAEEHRISRDGTIVDGGDKGGENREVGRRLDQAHPARHVDEDVQIPEREAAAALEHRE